MNLGNVIKIVVHRLLIEGMICLCRRDGFSTVNTLVYVMHI